MWKKGRTLQIYIPSTGRKERKERLLSKINLQHSYEKKPLVPTKFLLICTAWIMGASVSMSRFMQ